MRVRFDCLRGCGPATLVIVIVLRNRNMKTPINYLIMNMAVADLMFRRQPNLDVWLQWKKIFPKINKIPALPCSLCCSVSPVLVWGGSSELFDWQHLPIDVSLSFERLPFNLSGISGELFEHFESAVDSLIFRPWLIYADVTLLPRAGTHCDFSGGRCVQCLQNNYYYGMFWCLTAG